MYRLSVGCIFFLLIFRFEKILIIRISESVVCPEAGMGNITVDSSPSRFTKPNSPEIAAQRYPASNKRIFRRLCLLLFLCLLLVLSSEADVDCGAFGKEANGGWASTSAAATCECPSQYIPANETAWKSGNWSGGCVAAADPCTERSASVEYERLGNYFPPGGVSQGDVSSFDDCSVRCFNNCSCTGFAFTQYYHSVCYVWFGQIFHIDTFSDTFSSEVTFFLRLVFRPGGDHHRNNRLKVIIIAVSGGTAAAAATAAILIIFVLRKRAKAEALCKLDLPEAEYLRVFSYRELSDATAKFSRRIGSGGFATVFEGRLRDGSTVAVKKLQLCSAREDDDSDDKEFRAEVRTLGVIRHVNLVRLLGFCCERSSNKSKNKNRLLVYELMPNGSLAKALFASADGPCLDWNTRFGIAVGAARGISYLHEGCRDCIIHCDIKPDNVLLDAGFRPKIADFGLAKLLDRDYSKVLTTMRGTIGYLAPEWLSGDPITAKTDVYSFGVTLLELLSGQRNVGLSADSEALMYPIGRAMEISRGNFMAAVDPRISTTADPEQVRRLAVAGLRCIQDEPCLRPSMNEILLLLLQGEGAASSEMGVPPVPMSLLSLVSEPPCQASFLQWQPQSGDEDGDDGDDPVMLQRQVQEEET